jgi:hypothetical protein
MTDGPTGTAVPLTEPACVLTTTGIAAAAGWVDSTSSTSIFRSGATSILSFGSSRRRMLAIGCVTEILKMLQVLQGVAAAAIPAPTNIAIIFGDDVGYGDLSCFGHPTSRTPNLDRMAREGSKFVQSVLSPFACFSESHWHCARVLEALGTNFAHDEICVGTYLEQTSVAHHGLR